MSDTLTPRTAELRQSDVTAKKQQSLLHVGSENRDALEAIGATYEPPMRWQDLARAVLKNFIASSQHDAALKRTQLSFETGKVFPLQVDDAKHVLPFKNAKLTDKQRENGARTDFDLGEDAK